MKPHATSNRVLSDRQETWRADIEGGPTWCKLEETVTDESGKPWFTRKLYWDGKLVSTNRDDHPGVVRAALWRALGHGEGEGLANSYYGERND